MRRTILIVIDYEEFGVSDMQAGRPHKDYPTLYIFMEVLMGAIIKSFLVLSFALVFGASISYTQGVGVRVDADIPFDFSIGDKTFAAGKYELSVIRLYGSVHAVRMRDETGKVICNATAIQNGSTRPTGSDMLFAIVDGEHILDKIRTPDVGFVFSRTNGDKRIAKAKRESVPLSGATPN
jgi:hypothetical protein